MSLTNLCYKSLYYIIPQLLNFSLTHTQSRLTLHSYFLTKKAYLGWLGDLDKFLHHLTTVIFANLVMTFKKSYILDCLGIRVLYFNVFTYSLVQMHNTAYTRSTVVVVTAVYASLLIIHHLSQLHSFHYDIKMCVKITIFVPCFIVIPLFIFEFNSLLLYYYVFYSFKQIFVTLYIIFNILQLSIY